MSALLPLAVSIAIYSALSLLNPVEVANQACLTDIAGVFNINWVDLLPAVTILVLSIFQVEVKLSMVIQCGDGNGDRSDLSALLST